MFELKSAVSLKPHNTDGYIWNKDRMVLFMKDEYSALCPTAFTGHHPFIVLRENYSWSLCLPSHTSLNLFSQLWTAKILNRVLH